jgi:hypothetical protein
MALGELPTYDVAALERKAADRKGVRNRKWVGLENRPFIFLLALLAED